MEVVNDNRCSWINDLNPRTNIQTLLSDLSCEWLISRSWLHWTVGCKKIRSTLPKSKNIIS